MIEANGTSVAGGFGTDVAPALGDVGVLEAAVDGLRCRDTSNRSSNTCSLVGTGHGHYAKNNIPQESIFVPEIACSVCVQAPRPG